MDKDKAAKIIDYMVTITKPIWKRWIHQNNENLDDIFLTRSFEQGGFHPNRFYEILKKKENRLDFGCGSYPKSLY